MKTKRVCWFVQWDKAGNIIRRYYHDVPVAEERAPDTPKQSRGSQATLL